MSYLDKLKAKAAPNPFEGFAGAMREAVSAASDPFEGFEGAMREAVSAASDPFEGFEGDQSIGVSGYQPPPGAASAASFLELLQTRSESEVFRRKKPPRWRGHDLENIPTSGTLKTLKSPYGPPRAPGRPEPVSRLR